MANAFTILLSILFSSAFIITTNSQPSLNSVEQESLYTLLNSLNSDIPWRSLFPDDFCSSAPHGVGCVYTTDPGPDPGTVHIVELNFGYVSDHNPNPPCNPNSTISDPFIFASFPYLKKLFFYNCFTHQPVSLNSFSRVESGLEELVFIDNPGLFGSLTEVNGNITSLRRLVITGSNVSGVIPDGFFELAQNLEEVTLSGNKLAGKLPESMSKLKKLKILDLGQNEFSGNIPASFGELPELIKLDLSRNLFSGDIPASMKGLRYLELLDMSYNKFSNNGIPLFIREMSKLKGLFFSGNELGGAIPDFWGNLRGINGIGFSGLGLVGNIPSSMGVFLGNISYLSLDNNKLTGKVPLEFERLEMLNELNLKNNNLSGRLPFSIEFVSRLGKKLKVDGNDDLCVDERVFRSFSRGGLGHLKVCKTNEKLRSNIVHVSSSSSNWSSSWTISVMFLWLLFI